MIALYILLGLLLLLLLPVGARVRFDGECRITVRYAGVPVWRYTPEKAARRQARAEREKPRPAKKASKKAAKKPKEEKPSPVKAITERLRREGAGAAVAYLREMARLVTGTARRLLRALRFGHCTVLVAVAAEDAADTALRYGKLCAVAYPAQTLLLENLHIRRLDLDMRPDFRREEDAVWADIRLHTLPLRMIAAAVGTLIAYGRMMIQQEKKKGTGVENG